MSLAMYVFDFMWQGSVAEPCQILRISGTSNATRVAARLRGTGAETLSMERVDFLDASELPPCKVVGDFGAGKRWIKICEPVGECAYGSRFLVADSASAPVHVAGIQGGKPEPHESVWRTIDDALVAALSDLVAASRESKCTTATECRETLERLVASRWPKAAAAIVEAVDQSGDCDERSVAAAIATAVTTTEEPEG